MTLTALTALLLTPIGKAGTSDTKREICQAFGTHCQEAINVARCETGGTFDVNVRNGDHLGLFQVSSHWRRTVPGWGWTARAQARHAYRVFVKVGRRWSPHWSCAWAA